MCPKIDESANFFSEIGYASNGALLGPSVGKLFTGPRKSLQILPFAVVQNYTLCNIITKENNTDTRVYLRTVDFSTKTVKRVVKYLLLFIYVHVFTCSEMGRR